MSTALPTLRVSAFLYRYHRDVLNRPEPQARAELERLWPPGGVWATFIGTSGDAALPHRYPASDGKFTAITGTEAGHRADVAVSGAQPNPPTDRQTRPMRIAIASDHAAIDLKAELREYLIELGHQVADLGPETADRVDYPDYGYKLASVVADGTAERGVALCGSGIGISIAVNRNPALRCALVSEPLSAALAREHNDANAIAMGARLTGIDMAKACLDAFLSTDFGGGRHNGRVEKLSNPVT